MLKHLPKQFLRWLPAFLIALTGHVQAQAPGHYVPGMEGLLGSTLPPPGVYARDYNLFYIANQVNDMDGSCIKSAKFDALVYAQVPRVIWITDEKLLGGYLGFSALLPFIYQDVSFNGAGGRFSNSTFGVGDFMLDANMSWHTKQFDFVVAEGFFAPTGNSAPPPTTRAGQGFWSSLSTVGATWYMDSGREWALSALSRYETCSEQRDTNITPGNVYSLDWGLSNSTFKPFDFGIVGYFQQKVTSDEGPGSTSNNDRTAAVGPEIVVAFPKEELSVSCRYEYEFVSENRAQGHTVTLTLTKRF